MAELDNKRDTLMLVYRLSFSLGGFLFALATLATLPSSDQQFFNPLFKLLLRLSACCMIVSQTCELIGKATPYCRSVVFLIALLGNVGFIWATVQYQKFNKGEMYLIAAFLISLDYELKILFVILKGSNLSDVFMRHKNKFIRFVLVALGQILFLTGSVMLLVDSDPLVQKIITALGGVVVSLPIWMSFQKNIDKGYAQFNYQMQVSRVV